MKKSLLVQVMITVFALLLANTILAAIENAGGSLEKDVYAQKEALADADTVYYVDVSWGDMEFSYNAGTVKKVWDPSTHTYKDVVISSDGGWYCGAGANQITISNRSNKAISASISAEIDEEYSGIKASIDNEKITLADASKGASFTEAGTPSVGSAKITLSGKLTDEKANKTEIGNLKITISDAE